MRKIRMTDVFILSRIMKLGNVKDMISRFVASGKMEANKANSTAFGVEICAALMEVLAEPKAEDLFYKLLAGIAEKDEKDIKDMDIDDVFDILKEIAENNDLLRFFKSAGQLAAK